MQWQTVIGLEIHVQLNTKSKIFSGASIAYGAAPNSQACAVDLAMPGVLPVFNKRALEMAIKFGLAVGATINKKSVFARKNYFYPDLPKGYQISQLDLPIVVQGQVNIETELGKKTVNLTRAHLEEDAGKSLHDDFDGQSGIDLNRAGTPLLEIVSEPEMVSAKEAVAYMKTVHRLVRYLGICDGNLQEGSFRCDANVSLKPKHSDTLGTRTELKNLNSFRNIERAINTEIERQTELLEQHIPITQETRLYDADKNETRPMRSKEEANDYRYFPDPDLLPIITSQKMIDEIQKTLPELPDAKKLRFINEHGLSDYDASYLTSSIDISNYFETVLALSQAVKLSANWVSVNLAGALNKNNMEINDAPVSATHLGGMIKRIQDNTLNSKLAKKVFTAMWNGEGDADHIIAKNNYKSVSDNAIIEKIIDTIIQANPQQVEQLKAGKTKVMGFFVGQVMKASKGQANPAQVNQILQKKLDIH